SIALAMGIVVFTFTRPIKRLTQVMNTLATGSTDIAGRDTNRGEDTGDMAPAFQVFLNQAVAVRGLTGRIMENIRRVAMAASQASSAGSQGAGGSKRTT